MSDLKEDTLFELIRSLTGAEKRHFSIYAARHTIGTGNNSLRMFKKLEALRKYDEKDFLAANKKEGFVKHYGFNKHFLYKLILQSLHAFHKGNTMESKLREQLHCIDILSEKGLVKQARSLIKSSRKKAEKYQFHSLLLDLLNREMALNREEAFAGKTPDDLKAYGKQFKKNVDDISEIQELEAITARISLEINKGGLLRDKKVFEELIRLQGYKKMKNVPQTFYAAWHFYNARVGIHFLKQDHKKALADNEALLNEMEKRQHLIVENPTLYLRTLNNRMVLLSNFRRYDEMFETAKKLEEVPVRTQTHRNRKFNTYNGLVLQMYCKTGEFENGLESLKVANKKLNSKEVQFLDLQFEISHYLAAANIHFGLGDFASANKYLQQIADRRDLILRDDILSFALIMRIIVQFEMKKQDLLEYTVRSVYRFLYKRERLYKFERIVLDFIRVKSPHLDSQKKLVKAFKELHEQLIPLTKDPFEKNAFAYFDIIPWLESKIYGKPYKQLVRNKYLQEVEERR